MGHGDGYPLDDSKSAKQFQPASYLAQVDLAKEAPTSSIMSLPQPEDRKGEGWLPRSMVEATAWLICPPYLANLLFPMG